jgi:hypothetical protein
MRFHHLEERKGSCFGILESIRLWHEWQFIGCDQDTRELPGTQRHAVPSIHRTYLFPQEIVRSRPRDHWHSLQRVVCVRGCHGTILYFLHLHISVLICSLLPQKEAGMVLAARFSLFTGDYQNAIRVAKKVCSKTTQPSTPYELDAVAVEYWANLAMMDASGDVDWKYVQGIDQFVRNLGDNADVDLYMLFARSKFLLRKKKDSLNVLNKVNELFNLLLNYLIKLFKHSVDCDASVVLSSLNRKIVASRFDE